MSAVGSELKSPGELISSNVLNLLRSFAPDLPNIYTQLRKQGQCIDEPHHTEEGAQRNIATKLQGRRNSWIGFQEEPVCRILRRLSPGELNIPRTPGLRMLSIFCSLIRLSATKGVQRWTRPHGKGHVNEAAQAKSQKQKDEGFQEILWVGRLVRVASSYELKCSKHPSLLRLARARNLTALCTSANQKEVHAWTNITQDGMAWRDLVLYRSTYCVEQSHMTAQVRSLK